ncbi:MAG: hypothetical protein HYU36_21810 [Planctomycetes bacterium]|nr:hypothetical protein [Planctomycetota bacterium]
MPRGLFPSAPVLVSRAWWFLCEYPVQVGVLGLMGSAPFAALLLFYVREAEEGHYFTGSVSEAMRPVALGLAGVYFARFPFRLALARWMAQTVSGAPASSVRALGWAVLHLPTSLFYGAVSTLGWFLGSVLIVPFSLSIQANLAFHRFAVTRETAWTAFRESSRIPAGGVGSQLLAVSGVLTLCGFLILWMAPAAALGLAEWTVKADVVGLQQVFGLRSPPWIAISFLFPLIGVDLLWTVAFGLLHVEWQNLTQGADLLGDLRKLEKEERTAGGIVASYNK